MKRILFVFTTIALPFCIEAQIKLDSFIGAGYSPFIDNDSNKVLITSEKWTHYKASIGFSFSKNIFINGGLMLANLNYNNIFNNNIKNSYINYFTNVLYKESVGKKFQLDMGLEAMLSKHSMENDIPKVGKYALNFGFNPALSYRIGKDLYLSGQGFILFSTKNLENSLTG